MVALIVMRMCSLTGCTFTVAVFVLYVVVIAPAVKSAAWP